MKKYSGLSSAAVVIDALRVKISPMIYIVLVYRKSTVILQYVAYVSLYSVSSGVQQVPIENI